MIRGLRRRLASRVALAMLLIASLGSIVLALGVYFLNEGLESIVLQRQVRSELGTLMAEHDQINGSGANTVLQSYVGRDDPRLPAAVAALPPGDHHSVEFGGRRYQILVADRGGTRYYVAYDITEWEHREHWLILILIAGVLVVVVGSLWVGRWASGQVVEPVTRLAERVKSMRPDERNIRLAPDFQGAEVADIAEAFDRYLARVDGFVEREQLFTSAASHELRTPLTVMQGAADVLATQPDLSDVERRAVERIRRASRQMREFIDALLILSRERETGGPPETSCDLGALVEEILDDLRRVHAAESPDLRLRRQDDVFVAAPASMLAIVVGNLVRNAIENGEGGPVDVDLTRHSLSIANGGAGIPRDDLPHVFDRSFSTKADGGMGLFLAKNICDRLGWTLSVDSSAGQETRVTVTFAPREARRDEGGRDRA